MSRGRTPILLLRSFISLVGAQPDIMSLSSNLRCNRLLGPALTLLVERILIPVLLCTTPARKLLFWCRSSSHRCNLRRDPPQLAPKSKLWRKLLPNRVRRLQGTH